MAAMALMMAATIATVVASLIRVAGKRRTRCQGSEQGSRQLGAPRQIPALSTPLILRAAQLPGHALKSPWAKPVAGHFPKGWAVTRDSDGYISTVESVSIRSRDPRAGAATEGS